jgi:predicted phosphodiesterase
LPARWNSQALARVKVLHGGTVTFAVLGDSRNSHGVFPRLLKQMDGEPDLAFVIHLGDMVAKAGLDKYGTFFGQVRQNLHKPLLAVIGNHEVTDDPDLNLYRELFGPVHYAFRINNHAFIVVNDAGPDFLDHRQLNWLEEELQKARNCRTRLVFLHVPLFDPRQGGHHHALPEERGRQLAALFSRYRVTHIFAGHIHGYFSGNWSGVPYTITGGGGAELQGTDPRHFFFHYVKVCLSGHKVQIKVECLKAGRPVSRVSALSFHRSPPFPHSLERGAP